MPLEWTGNQRFPVCVPKSLPATQGRRSKDPISQSAYLMDLVSMSSP